MFGRSAHTTKDGVRIARKDRTGMNPVRAGMLALLAATLVTYFGFTKHIPFTHGFRVKAVFTQANSIRLNSPVRIAGVNVGKVKKVERYKNTDAALITMEVKDEALPIHKDATLKIRPRIFLEGNYFVDISPGTAAAPTIDDGDTIPITHTATPVQLDQLLSALQSNTRQQLRDVLDGFGTALTYQPTAADDLSQDPASRGESAAQSLNDALDYGADAFRGQALVNQGLLGSDERDLSKLVSGFGRVAGALATNETQLKDFVTNFNRTLAALAVQEGNLRSAVRLLAPTVSNANRALTSLNAALPATRAFAREILPGVRETPATVDAALPWIAQARKLVAPAELGGLLKDLRPSVVSLAQLTDRSLELLPQADLTARCASNNIIPNGDVVIEEGPLSSGTANYKEFWHGVVGLAGEGQNFDGNGSYVRFQTGGGPYLIATDKSLGLNRLFANSAAAPLGVKPAYPGKVPPLRPDVPCYKNKRPDLNGPAAAVGPSEALTRAAPRVAAASTGAKP